MGKSGVVCLCSGRTALELYDASVGRHDPGVQVRRRDLARAGHSTLCSPLYWVPSVHPDCQLLIVPSSPHPIPASVSSWHWSMRLASNVYGPEKISSVLEAIAQCTVSRGRRAFRSRKQASSHLTCLVSPALALSRGGLCNQKVLCTLTY